MKLIFSFTFFIAVIAASAQWIDITPDTTWSYGNHSFPTANDGYAIREATDVLYKTIDGGATWTTLTVDSTLLTDVHFVSPMVGYVTGNKVFPTNLYNVAKTIDGGNTWTPVAPVISTFTNVYFENALEGYVSGNYGNLFKTSDGGSSWTAVVTSSSEMSDKSFSSTSDTNFFAGWDGTFAYRGAIQRTTDGGATWSETVLTKLYSSIIGLHMLNGKSGIFALGQWGTPNGTHLYTTVDGFANLDSVLKPTLNVYDVFYESNSSGYLAADSGRIYKTTDGSNFVVDHNHGVPFSFKRFSKTGNTLFAAGVKVILKNNLGTGIGVGQLDAKDFVFYPNPTLGALTIELPSAVQIAVVDVHGRTIDTKRLSKGKTYLDVSRYAPGVYFLTAPGIAKKLLIH